MAAADLRVLFRAPAGPRRGFGHLVRCRSLARALGVTPVIAMRGGERARAAARALGFEVVPGSAAAALARIAPDVLVVDDPIATDARRWIACARRTGCRVVTIHDLGLGAQDGDLVVDGSVVRAARGGSSASAKATADKKDPQLPPGSRPRVLRGPRFVILDPAFSTVRRAPGYELTPRVLIALGGGPRAALAHAIARAVRLQLPWARIRIAGGFATTAPADRGQIAWTGPIDGLAGELSACDVAVVGGGVSLYEACARGVAVVAVPVVVPQRPTVRGFVALQAARGRWAARDTDSVAREVVQLLWRPDVRTQLGATGRRLVDGRGALRVADAVRRLASGRGRGPAKERTRRTPADAMRRVS